MRKTLVPYSQIPQLAKTDIAYATGDARLQPFYAYKPALDSFAEIIGHRATVPVPRTDLVTALTEQYAGLPVQEAVSSNILALAAENTFTVVTAHQPSLLLGPLYFLYKALTTINLAEQVQQKNAGRRIVPVFVLGSEDHDLEELNSINLFSKKLVWQSPEKGAVGAMHTASLAPLLTELRGILGENDAAQALFVRIEKAYTGQSTIADATRAMLHDLFGAYGLVVLNMSAPLLKRHFIPVIKAELLEQPAARLVQQTTDKLNALGFKTQAAPRDINLFYLRDGFRERIVLEGGVYKVLNSDFVFKQAEILAELEAHPERFSPNVVLRPLYQEMILPNLAYIGGGGELAYWLERKALFAHFQVPFPLLLRRNSVLWLDRDSVKKLAKFGFTAPHFFEDTESLVRQYVAANLEGEVDLSEEMAQLHAIFDQIARKATVVDATLEKAVRADEVKTVGSLEQWQSRLLRTEKQKHEVTLNQLRALKEKLFPNNGLQERTDNFMPYVLKYGPVFIETLKAELQPFDAGFVVLEEA